MDEEVSKMLRTMRRWMVGQEFSPPPLPHLLSSPLLSSSSFVKYFLT
jgi:hypothetical protein